MTKKDGSECRGCGNLGILGKFCRKEHEIKFMNGCRDCGDPIREEVYYDQICPKDYEKGIVCEDYFPDPNYWQKDPYG